MGQYKELSGIRNEQEKVINAQKILKLQNEKHNMYKQHDIDYQQKDFDEMVERLNVID